MDAMGSEGDATHNLPSILPPSTLMLQIRGEASWAMLAHVALQTGSPAERSLPIGSAEKKGGPASGTEP